MDVDLLLRDSLFSRLKDSYLSVNSFDRESYIMDLFQYQYRNNPVYQQYCHWLHTCPEDVSGISNIPLLPVSAFKMYQVKTGNWEAQTVFKSSGTTQVSRSQHFVRDQKMYLDHTAFIWQHFFGPVRNYCFLALLPGYVDRGDSSLVCMVHDFIQRSRHNASQFVLGKENTISDIIKLNHHKGIRTVLFGVSFALLELLETFSIKDADLMIIETGGMKGLREDMTKEELFSTLKSGFESDHVYSEYGMTELFSQAYTSGGFDFFNPMYFDIRIRQFQDPLEEEKMGKQGILGCIDLANIDSCAFILTEDAGFISGQKTFRLTGRLDNSDIRGCNLLLSEEFR